MPNRTSYVTRNVDDLGRIVIPKEIRQAKNILQGDPIGIISTDEGILLVPVDETQNIKDEVARFARIVNENYPTNCRDDLYKRDAILKKINSISNIINGIPETEEDPLMQTEEF